MSNEIATWFAIIQGALTLLGLVYVAGVRIARIEVKVDTMWDFQMRRAVAEGVHRGILTKNSPLKPTPLGEEWLAPLRKDLQGFYQAVGHKLNTRDLIIEIERKFGARIAEEVCIPHNIHQGSCLLVAAEIAKETE